MIEIKTKIDTDAINKIKNCLFEIDLTDKQFLKKKKKMLHEKENIFLSHNLFRDIVYYSYWVKTQKIMSEIIDSKIKAFFDSIKDTISAARQLNLITEIGKQFLSRLNKRSYK